MFKSNLGKKGVYFILQLVVHHPGKSGHELKYGKNVETGNQVEAMEE